MAGIWATPSTVTGVGVAAGRLLMLFAPANLAGATARRAAAAA